VLQHRECGTGSGYDGTGMQTVFKSDGSRQTGINVLFLVLHNPPLGGGVLPYMGYIGMCRCEGYGFQAVYSRIGYINQSVWV